MLNQELTHWMRSSHCHGAQLTLKELMYYKSKATLLNLRPKKRIKSPMSGQYLAPHKGRGMEFAEVRLYQPGDDIRSIDWRVTARTGKAHTKLYQEEKERPVFVVADFSSPMLFGSQLLFKSIQVAHLAAMIAWNACQRGDRIGGLVFNNQQHKEIKPGSRQKAVMRFFHQLLEVHETAFQKLGQASDPQSFEQNCARIKQLAKPGSLVYILSDFSQMNEQSLKHLKLLARHCEVIAYCVNDPFESEIPTFSQPLEVDTGNGKWVMPLMDDKFRQHFNSSRRAIGKQRDESLSFSGIGLKHISAHLPLEWQLSNQL